MSRQHLILLGYKVGVGEGVTIPLGHMAVTGQTQQAGKTTTLEALAHRASRAVIAFVTKRGESAFGATPGHAIRSLPPYFRERADWQFVEAVLEATMRERMKYERQWIMKVSRGAKTLVDVRENTSLALDNARGEFMKSTYEKLLAYLDIVVPQIEKIRWAAAVEPANYLNVMNLSAMTSELQALVIASTLDYVMEHLKDVVVIVPEAWEFLPRGRKSPVTLAGESYVRKGAALRNYLWIDSQDLAGVHTPILKQTQVFLLGVQREINEIKRTINHLHGPAKPKPQQIAQLGLGQFIACWGSTAVATYVQPWWMDETEARLVAVGSIETPTPPLRLPTTGQPVRFTGFQPPMPATAVITDIEDPMDTQLREENERLTKQVTDLLQTVHDLRNQLATYHRSAADLARESVQPGPPGDTAGAGRFTASDLQVIFSYVRNALLADGHMMAVAAKIAASRPELIIELTPKAFAFNGETAKGRLAKMIAGGILDEPVKPGVLIKEFKRTGGEIHPSRLSEYLGEFVSMGFVVRVEDLYQRSPALKVTTRELQATV